MINKNLILIFMVVVMTQSSRATEEDYLLWKNIKLTLTEYNKTEETTIEVDTDGVNFKSLIITSFGQKNEVINSDLKKLKDFELQSLKSTISTDSSGNDILYFSLTRVRFIKPKVRVKEEVLISVSKNKGLIFYDPKIVQSSDLNIKF